MPAREIYTTVRRMEAAKRQNPQEGQQRSVSIGYALPGIWPEKDSGEQLHPVTSLPGRRGQVQAHLAQGSNKARQLLPVLASRVKSGASAERTLEALLGSPRIRTLRPQWPPASSLPKSAGDALALRSCATSSSQRRPSSEPPAPSFPVLPVEVAPRTQTVRASAGACVHWTSAGSPGIARPLPSSLPSARRSPPAESAPPSGAHPLTGLQDPMPVLDPSTQQIPVQDRQRLHSIVGRRNHSSAVPHLGADASFTCTILSCMGLCMPEGSRTARSASAIPPNNYRLWLAHRAVVVRPHVHFHPLQPAPLGQDREHVSFAVHHRTPRTNLPHARPSPRTPAVRAHLPVSLEHLRSRARDPLRRWDPRPSRARMNQMSARNRLTFNKDIAICVASR